jgi:hypothetical protein
MKILNASPGSALERSRCPGTRIAIITSAVAGLALAGALLYQHNTHAAQLARVHTELAMARAEARQLRTDLTAEKTKLDAAIARTNTCTGNLSVETSRVGAFAKQAAACEAIRARLQPAG